MSNLKRLSESNTPADLRPTTDYGYPWATTTPKAQVDLRHYPPPEPPKSVPKDHSALIFEDDPPDPKMASQQPRTRPKERAAGDEEAAADLKLGEFEDVPTLSNSEVRLLVNAVKEKRVASGKPMPDSEILLKTEDYLQMFSRFKNKENIAAVEKILDQTGLQRFERSQLGNLCCESAEEAKTLVASLANKISDSELQEVLDEITKMRNFTE